MSKGKYLLALLLMCAAMRASAAVSGIYNYEISNNKAVITGLTAEGANATTLNIPGRITSGSSHLFTIVGEGAFQNNTKLKKVNIMWGCQKLEANAFAGCSNLTELRIPSSMSYSSSHYWMGDGCLSGCTSLQLLSISADYVPFVSDATLTGVPTSCILEVPNGDPHVSDYVKTGYYFAITNSTWNKFNIRIGAYDYYDSDTGLAFNLINSSMSAVLVRSTTTASLSGAISIPETIVFDNRTFTVKSIERRAFENCTGITSVTMPITVTHMWGGYGEGSLGYSYATEDGAQFNGCTALTKVTMSPNIEAIPTRCFYGCSNLTQVPVNYGPKYIGADAFNGVPITTLSLPSSLEEFRGWEIRGMSRLIQLNLNLTYDKIKMSSDFISDLTNLYSLLVPVGNVLQYKNDPYFGHITQIKAGAIDMGSTAHGFTVTKAPTGTGKENCGEVMRVYADWRNDNTTSFNLGGYQSGAFNRWFRVTSIGDSAFVDCTKLETVTVDPSWEGTISRIPDYAFDGCTSLTSFPFEDSHFRPLTYIGKRAFYSSGLTGSVNLYNDTYGRSLGDYAFYNCSNMTELIVFGTSMGNDAFGGPTMSSNFRCYVIYPNVARCRNSAASWINGKSWAPSRIMPFLVSNNSSMVISMPSAVSNAQHCVLPTSTESGGTLKFYAVTGYNPYFAGEFKSTQLAAGSAVRAGDGVLVTGLTPGRIYRMDVPSITPAAISGNMLVGNPYPSGTSITREDDSYYYYYRSDNEDFYRYYNDFTVPFGGAYLRDTKKNSQNTIINLDALCYPLMVASTRVKPANASNITSSYIKSGTANYDPGLNVLTFNNLKIETGATSGGMQAQIADMTVRLVGNNNITITGTNNYAVGMSFNESSGVTITGGGTLTLNGGNNGHNIFLNTLLPVDSVMFTIKDCTVNGTPFSDDYEDNLTVDNATLRGTGLSIGCTLVLKDCYVAKPAGAGFEYGMLTVDGQYYYGDFEILPGSGLPKGDVNGDGVVSGSDVTALYNYLLDGIPCAGDGDVNGDGVISGADVTALYNILLN